MTNTSTLIHMILDYNECSLKKNPNENQSNLGSKIRFSTPSKTLLPYELNEKLEFELDQNAKLKEQEDKIREFLLSEKPIQIRQEKIIVFQFKEGGKKLLLMTTLSHYVDSKMQTTLKPEQILFLDYL